MSATPESAPAPAPEPVPSPAKSATPASRPAQSPRKETPKGTPLAAPAETPKGTPLAAPAEAPAAEAPAAEARARSRSRSPPRRRRDSRSPPRGRRGRSRTPSVDPRRVDDMCTERQRLRERRDFRGADDIYDRLRRMGVTTDDRRCEWTSRCGKRGHWERYAGRERSVDSMEVDRLCRMRQEAKNAKDYDQADKCRDILRRLGVSLDDGRCEWECRRSRQRGRWSRWGRKPEEDDRRGRRRHRTPSESSEDRDRRRRRRSSSRSSSRSRSRDRRRR